MIAPQAHRFGDHDPVEGIAHLGGVRYLFTFPNGWAASVVRSPYTFGGDQGLWEAAIMGPDGNVSHDTHLESPEGYLDRAGVTSYLDAVRSLPDARPEQDPDPGKGTPPDPGEGRGVF